METETQERTEAPRLRLGSTAPDFEADTTEGRIRFHEWIGDSWAVLFSHPKDFTPVCTTELGYLAELKPEFDRRGVKVIGLSVDPLDAHALRGRHRGDAGHPPELPADRATRTTRSRSSTGCSQPTPAATRRADAGRQPDGAERPRDRPDKTIKLYLAYPMTTGRNFDEILRVIDSLQLTANHKVATPANWKQGDDVIIAGSVSDEAAKGIWPDGWETPLPYMRVVRQPKESSARP